MPGFLLHHLVRRKALALVRSGGQRRQKELSILEKDLPSNGRCWRAR